MGSLTDATGLGGTNEEGQENEEHDDQRELVPGDRVELVLLKSEELNGRLEDVLSFNGQRYRVRFLPDSSASDVLEKLIKRENLRIVPKDRVPAPPQNSDIPSGSMDFL